jgi:hypothetical protein
VKTNVGGADRWLRIIVGLALMSLYFLLEGPARAWSLAGLVLLVTGVSRFCLLYTVFGINTNSTGK